MAQIDPSIPLAAKVPEPGPGPLDRAGKLLSLQQGMLNSKLLGQTVAGKIAYGKAAQAATDDQGRLDPNKLMIGLSSTPEGAQLIPEAAKFAQDQRISAISEQVAKAGLTKEQLAIAATENENGARIGQALLATGDTSKDFVTRLGDSLVPSMIRSPEGHAQWDEFKKGLTDDPAQNAKMIQNFVNGRTDIAKAIGAVRDVDTGGQIQQMRSNPATGDTQILSSVGKTLAPAEAVKPAYQRFNPATGQMENVLTGDAVAAMNGGTGGNTAPPGVAAGPALGQAEGAAAAAGHAVNQLATLQQEAERVPVTRSSLMNLRDQLSKFTPGPKANWTYALGALAQQLGVASPKVTEGVAAQEEFNKLATQFINQQVATIGGGGTDSKLESSAKGSPNEFMSKEGNQNVIALMLGLNEATGAKNEAWQKWTAAGNGPETYPKFVAQFNKLYNPRVFQSQFMSDQQRATMLGNMTPDERKRFQKEAEFAKNAGWLQ